MQLGLAGLKRESTDEPIASDRLHFPASSAKLVKTSWPGSRRVLLNPPWHKQGGKQKEPTVPFWMPKYCWYKVKWRMNARVIQQCVVTTFFSIVPYSYRICLFLYENFSFISENWATHHMYIQRFQAAENAWLNGGQCLSTDGNLHWNLYR